jgi:hypothetical protein
MQSFSGLAVSRAPEAFQENRRHHYRHPINSLVYVTLDEGNGGIIRNLSQNGAAIQAVVPLRLGQTLRMRFDLLNPRMRQDVRALVTWANSSGQAGVRFTEIAPHNLRQMNDWIFVHLLQSLEQASPVFNLPREEDELIFSASARPAIRMPLVAPHSVVAPVSARHAVLLPWWPSPISQRGLAKLMDGLVLFSAWLMFFCIFLAVAHTLPAWPIAATVGVGVCGFFTALYGFLGAWIGCGTAGAQLAKIAMRDSEHERMLREEEARFR